MGTTTSNLSDYGEEIVLAYLISQIVAVGLFSVAGGEAGPGTEFDAADYERKAVTWVQTDDTATNSSAAIAFGTPATNWGTAVEARGFNSYGDAVAYYPISPGVDCDEGAPVSIPISGLVQKME